MITLQDLLGGYFCWQDNGALAKFKDNVFRLANAVKYLTSPPATQALGHEVYGRKGRITNKRRKSKKKVVK